MVTNESSNRASERIFILIGLLNEIEKLNTENSNTSDADLIILQSILYDTIETVAEKNNSTSHHVERILNDVITGDDMRLNIVHFCNHILKWLATGDKSALKEILIKNVSEDNHNSDLQAIESWYNE